MAINHSPMKHQIHYGTTDLALEAPHELTPLADALVQRGLLMYYKVWQHKGGLWRARFTTEEGLEEPDQSISAMVTAIESLDEPVGSLWAACTLREFDIAYECGDEPVEFSQQLSTATLSRIVSIGAAVRITLYPVIDTAPIDAAVDILKKDKSIKGHIGKLTGHGYHQVHWPSSKKDLAEVKVTLSGTKGSVSVHCKMELNNQEEWIVKQIIEKEDRLHSPNA